MKTTSRIKSKGEIFTPPPLVNEIFDELPKEVWDESKTFCDPTCGDGVFLREAKLRLLKKKVPEKNIIFNQLFGADIMMDNAMDTIFNIIFASKLNPYPSQTADIKRYDKKKNELSKHLSLEDNNQLALSVYNNTFILVQTTLKNLNLSNTYIGVEQNIIEQEIKDGIMYFNFFNGNQFYTYPNVVCCDSLKYGFTFGRE